jgi:hypothetical protein
MTSAVIIQLIHKRSASPNFFSICFYFLHFVEVHVFVEGITNAY